ncbi:hypothetical protein HYV11_01190 [Candidatus Dependentiae bacterium]|nr:hypothetical protein [Candidatus Dependentiae bacterium]
MKNKKQMSIISFSFFFFSLNNVFLYPQKEINVFSKKNTLYREEQEEEELEKKINNLAFSIYPKIIELVALYYASDLIPDSQILYEKKIIELKQDTWKLIKFVSIYIPLICKDKKITWKTKIKKLSIISGILFISISLINNNYNKKPALKT